MRVWSARITSISIVLVITACGVQQVSDSDDGAKDATQPEPTDAAIQQVASPSAVAPAGAPAGAPAHIEDTVLQAEQAIVSREAPNRGKGESFAEQSHALVRLTSRLPRGYPQPAYNAAENYQTYAENSIKRAAEEPLSTFSIDVDTGPTATCDAT